MDFNDEKYKNINDDELLKKEIKILTEPRWLANLALVLCILSSPIGLIFAIFGLIKIKDPKSIIKCIVAIIILVLWIALSLFLRWRMNYLYGK